MTAKSQYDSGMQYLNGGQSPPDELHLQYKGNSWGDGHGGAEEAFHCFKSAAEEGHVEAQSMLARCYLNGKGCRKSKQLFLKWAKQAASAGSADAQVLLGLYFQWPEENEVEEKRWLKMAADQNDLWGLYFYASCFLDDKREYTAEAIALLKRSADFGNEEAKDALDGITT